MVKVEVLKDSFKDKENFKKEIIVIRDGKEIKLKEKLLKKGDVYEITKERYDYLSKKGIVAKVKKEEKQSEVSAQ